jgi:hypothetical protein
MLCPKCNIQMGPTYEPYELRCSKCGYWFDTYTGKEVVIDLSVPTKREIREFTEEVRESLELLPPTPWTWDESRLVAADGTVILWSVADCHGKKYIGVYADCEAFIAEAADCIKSLVAIIDGKPRQD